MAYDFSPKHPLHFLAMVLTSNILATRFNTSETIFFALLNQKMTYNCRHQPQFIKVGK